MSRSTVPRPTTTRSSPPAPTWPLSSGFSPDGAAVCLFGGRQCHGLQHQDRQPPDLLHRRRRGHFPRVQPGRRVFCLFGGRQCHGLQCQNRQPPDLLHRLRRRHLPRVSARTAQSFAFSAEGNVTVYSARTDNHQIFSTGADAATFLGFSPDSASFAFSAGGNVTVYSAKTDNHQIFSTGAGAATFLGFSPDGEPLAFSAGGNVTVYSARDGQPPDLLHRLRRRRLSGFQPGWRAPRAFSAGGNVTVYRCQDRQPPDLLHRRRPPLFWATAWMATRLGFRRAGNVTIYSTRIRQPPDLLHRAPAPAAFLGYSFDRTPGTSQGGPNDNCADATVIANLPFTQTADTASATPSQS